MACTMACRGYLREVQPCGPPAFSKQPLRSQNCAYLKCFMADHLGQRKQMPRITATSERKHMLPSDAERAAKSRLTALCKRSIPPSSG